MNKIGMVVGAWTAVFVVKYLILGDAFPWADGFAIGVTVCALLMSDGDPVKE